ncbi:MAG: hypothetical protein R6U27_12020 [Desulfobacterales bacterium]
MSFWRRWLDMNASATETLPVVAVVMGSKADYKVMKDKLKADRKRMRDEVEDDEVRRAASD